MPRVAKIASMRWWGSAGVEVYSVPQGAVAQQSWRSAARRVKVGPSGRSFRSPCGEGVRGAEGCEAVEKQAALRVPLVLLEREVAAHHAEPGGAEADDGGSEAAAVQAGGEGQQDVLGAFDGGSHRAEERGARGGRATGQDRLAGRGREPGQLLAPAEEAGASWTRTRSGAQAWMTRARAVVSSRIERML